MALYDVEAGTNKRTKLSWVNSKVSYYYEYLMYAAAVC